MTPDQEARLPQYAQQELKVLRMRLDEARTQLHARNSDVDGWPRIVIEPYSDYPTLYSAMRNKVRFQFAERFDQYLDITHKSQNQVEVHSGRSLSLRPSAANTVRVSWELDY